MIPKSTPAPGGVKTADFPDGGLEACLVFLGDGYVCSAVSCINCIGVFQEYYQRNLLAGYPSSTVSWVSSLEVFMMFSGGPIFGKVFDNIGPRWLLLGFSAFTVIGLWLPSSGNVAIIIFCLLYGFSSGAFVSMGPSLVTQISPIRELGPWSGAFFLCVAFGGLTGNPIGGAFIESDHEGFHHLQLFCGVTMSLGTLTYIANRWDQVGFKPEVI
ncbi:uncharacterized protein RSE6_16030 [Rhynchosporium secalis]|uniref:Major facilitator superfamily (MFS) profile domain-containing protein n=1 Tax=Rhynchosporium secalis TaxID=38038 RepID=A0A1E1M0F1_RHYSE|nr:uncharacterized protein RSE6_16030 [Rhynchosporium secalis]